MAQVKKQRRAEGSGSRSAVVAAGDPYLTGHLLLDLVRNALNQHQGRVVEKVLIGDLRSIRSCWNPDAIRRAVAVLLTLLRELRIPAVLFETSAPRKVRQLGEIAYIADIGHPEPGVVDLADVVVELRPTVSSGATGQATITDVLSGRQQSWQLTSPD
jgi:hypothetical protein